MIRFDCTVTGKKSPEQQHTHIASCGTALSDSRWTWVNVSVFIQDAGSFQVDGGFGRKRRNNTNIAGFWRGHFYSCFECRVISPDQIWFVLG